MFHTQSDIHKKHYLYFLVFVMNKNVLNTIEKYLVLFLFIIPISQ